MKLIPPSYLKTSHFWLKTSVVVFSLIIGLISTQSCQKDSEVKLEVINKEIYFVPIVEGQFQYKDEKERKKAANIITYNLKNTTNKKLLFVFNKMELNPSDNPISPTTHDFGYMGFYIKKQTDSIKRFNFSLSHFPGGCDDYNLSSEELKRKNYTILGARDIKNTDNFINNSIIIYPGETRTFKAIIHLSLISERDERIRTSPVFYHLDETDTFQLFYFCKAKAMKNSLPEYLQNDLEKNNIEIFDGKLTANPVKLRKR